MSTDLARPGRTTRGSRPVAPPAGLLASTALRMTRARFAARQGETLLSLASVMAYAVSSALALTVAGGTWMFWNRWQSPWGIAAELIAIDPTFESVLSLYFVFAMVACALVVPSMVSLAASAATLGARGRERRLSALRLIGLSSGDVTRMSLTDTVLQATGGTVVGLVVYLVTLPLWENMTFIGEHLTVAEMLLPWWGLLGLCAGVVLLGLASAWWGLQQVRISPLGVARRTNGPALKVWRLLAFVVALVVGNVAIGVLSLGGDMTGWAVLVTIMVVMIGGLNLVGPWFLQQESRIVARWPHPSTMWAARRIQANPKATWQRVAGMGLMALIGGYIALMPVVINSESAGEAGKTFRTATQWDFTKGAIIVLAVGFVLTATSLMITQASAVFERAEQSVALHRMGARDSYGLGVMWLETLGPLVLSTVLGAGLGVLMALPMYQMAKSYGFDNTQGVWVMGIVLVAGLLLTVAALTVCHPLQRRVLADQHRRND